MLARWGFISGNFQTILPDLGTLVAAVMCSVVGVMKSCGSCRSGHCIGCNWKQNIFLSYFRFSCQVHKDIVHYRQTVISPSAQKKRDRETVSETTWDMLIHQTYWKKEIIGYARTTIAVGLFYQLDVQLQYVGWSKKAKGFHAEWKFTLIGKRQEKTVNLQECKCS